MSGTFDEEEPFLAVGIDFGTTFSGVAWALSTRPKDIDIISSWDSETDHNSDSVKVPTQIAYSRHGNVTTWGFDLDPIDRQLSWFKLLLCEATKKRAASQHLLVDKLEHDLKELGKAPVDVVADYLFRLWSHATTVLKSRIGEALFDNIPIKMVLTTPAIWDHQAQELTRQAAERAGLVYRTLIKLELVSEPEAAARYVLNESLSLEVNDSFVVCDAGGGTVDLISYKVEKLKPLRLSMLTEATGDLHGAVFLDDAFEHEVQSTIGEDAYVALSERGKKKMMSDWEHGIKRNFKHNERQTKDFYIDIPGFPGLPPSYSASTAGTSSRSSAGILTPQLTGSTISSLRSLSVSNRAGGEPGVLKMKTPQLEKIFDSVCPRIVELVEEQVDAVKKATLLSPNAIFLVGGFGANKYLKQELQLKFPKIEIQQPKDAWSAIARGAVCKGLSDETVTNHISKYNYGVRYHTDFIEGKHAEADKQWSTLECMYKAHNQMRWYTCRGDNISKSHPVRHAFYQALTSASQLDEISTTVYYDHGLIAPKTTTSSVQKLCRIYATFSSSVWDDLPVCTNSNGGSYRKLNYDVIMKVSSGSLEWVLDYAGLEKGSARIAIDYIPEVGAVSK